MFNQEPEPRGFSPPLFLVQLFAAPLGSLICGGLAAEVFRGMMPAAGNLRGYFFYSFFGFVLGYKMQVSFLRAIDSGGRWIWIPPVCLAILSILHDSSAFHRSMLSTYLWPPSGPDNGGRAFCSHVAGYWLMFLFNRDGPCKSNGSNRVAPFSALDPGAALTRSAILAGERNVLRSAITFCSGAVYILRGRMAVRT